jgi:hypothetical protein
MCGILPVISILLNTLSDNCGYQLEEGIDSKAMDLTWYQVIVLPHCYYPGLDDYNKINQFHTIKRAILPSDHGILLASCSPCTSRMHWLPTHITKEIKMLHEPEMDSNDVGQLVMDLAKCRSADTPALSPQKMPQQSSRHPLGKRLKCPHQQGEVVYSKLGLVRWHLLQPCKLQPLIDLVW